MKTHPPVIVSAPASEPVTTSEAKDHLRVDLSTDDTLIGNLVTAARTWIEQVSGVRFITQTLDVSIDGWPAGDALALPVWPVASITSITSYALDGTASTVSASTYRLDTFAIPPRVVLVTGNTWPTGGRALNSGTVRLVAGTAAGSVPGPLRQAVLLLVAHLYEQREPVALSGAVPKVLPFAVEALLGPYLLRGGMA